MPRTEKSFRHYSPAQQETSRRLQRIPNVGPAMADDLYDALCRLDGVRHDPCVRDVFAAAVDFAEGGPPRPWWAFTPGRKARDAAVRGEPT